MRHLSSMRHLAPRVRRLARLAAAFSAFSIFRGDLAASEVGRPILRAFTPRLYGADAQNLCAVQDAAGVMYFGNTNGVLTYDGATWRVIRTGYSENIRGLALADDGNIYVGGTRQIGFLRPTARGREYVSLIDRLPPGDHDFSVFLQVVAQRDAVYFVTAKLVLMWRHGAFTLLPVQARENDLMSVHTVGDDTFVCAANQPLQRIRDGRLETVSDDAFFRDQTVRFIERAPDGGFVLGTLRHGFFHWHDGTFTPLATDADELLRTRGLFRARRLRDGSLALLILNQGGVLFVDAAGKFVWRLDENAGAPSVVAGDAVPDREGGLWLCLSTGLARLEWPAPFSIFDRAGAPVVRGRTALRHAGRFYFGADDGLYEFVPGSFESGNAHFEQIRKGLVTAMVADDGGPILATSDAGLVQMRGREFVKIFSPPKLVFALLRSHRDPNRLWLASVDDVRSIYRTGDEWRDEGAVPGVKSGSRTLAETDDGAVWSATLNDGAYRVRLGAPTPAEPRGAVEVTHFAAGTHGLPDKRNTMRVYAWGGRALISQGGTGLWLHDPASDRFAPLPQIASQIPEPDRLALFLSASHPDHLWVERDTNIPRELALFRVPRSGAPQQLPHAFADAAHFSRMLFEEPGPDGPTLWVSGNDGLLRVETSRAFAAPTEFAAFVTSDIARDGAELPPQHRAVTFEAVAPRFRSGGAVEYQSRLTGLDDNWSPWSEERKRTFTNLDPGRYRYEVRARDNDGQLTPVASLAFTLLPPWWQRWPAWLGFGLVGAAVVLGLVRLRTLALERRNQQLEDLVATRTEDLRRQNHELARLHQLELDEKITARLAEEKARLDVLRYQLNPHFLFNSLTSIRSQIPPALGAARDTLDRLADFCRLTLHGRRPAESSSVGEEIVMLRAYLDIEQTRLQELLSVELDAPAALEAAALPRLLLLPLVENALKYGSVTSPPPLRLRIAARRSGGGPLELEVANTGQWVAQPAAHHLPTHGIGHDNLRERLRRHYPDAHEFTHEERDGWVIVRLRLSAPDFSTPPFSS
ncbi:MAG: histidine kinase [Opitutae bacterium]|nr:histidine kinase [Opitutae bacterium]